MTNPGQFCTWWLGDQFFGVDVTRVQEVIRRPMAMTRVPLAPAAVSGLINLRGRIVPAIDLRKLLDLPPRPPGASPANVVVRSEDGAVSFLVDAVGDLLGADPGAFERPPETLQGPARDLILGAYKLEDRLLLILDVDQTIDRTARPKPAAIS